MFTRNYHTSTFRLNFIEESIDIKITITINTKIKYIVLNIPATVQKLMP